MFVVPYDGSELSKAALGRASEFARDEELIALTVIPSGRHYAKKKGWSSSVDGGEIKPWLEKEVHEIAPDAVFEFVRTESRPPAAKISKIIRRKARSYDADVVFLGSEHAGKRMSPVSSIGPSIAADEHFDVYLARIQD